MLAKVLFHSSYLLLRSFFLLIASLSQIGAQTHPANDDFPGAMILDLPAAIRTENAGATSEAGEPRIVATGIGATLWWTWRAPANGRLNLRAFDYPISLGIFQGDAVERLSLLSSGSGTVSAPVRSGGLYRILVDAWPDHPVGVWFDASFDPAPENDNTISATPILGSRATIRGNNYGASLEPGESAGSPAVGSSIWYSWKAPLAGWVSLTTTSTNGRPFLKVYRARDFHPTNHIVTSEAIGPVQTLAAAEFEAVARETYYIGIDTWPPRGEEPGFADFELRLDLTTLRIVAPVNRTVFAAGVLPVFEINVPLTSVDGTLRKVEYRYGDWYSSFGSTTNPPFTLMTPWIRTGRWEVRAYAENDSGEVRVSPSIWFTVRPDNDDFASSTKLKGYRWGFDAFRHRLSLRGSTEFATVEPGEPFHGTKPAVASVWFSWTAPASGSAEFYAELRSGVAVAAYSGDALTQLVSVPLTHTPGEPFRRLQVVRGTTYHFAAFSESAHPDSFATDFGIALSLQTVRLVSPPDGTITTAPTTLPLGIQLTEEPGRIRRVEYWANYTSIGASEAPPFEATWWDPPPGLYGIRAVALNIDGFQIETPSSVVTIRPANDDFASRAELNGPIVTARSTHTTATQEPDEPGHGLQSVWWSWAAPATGQVTVDTTGSSHNPHVAIYTGSDLKNLSRIASGYGRFEFPAVQGVTYDIAVVDWLYGGEAVLNLRLMRPALDLRTLHLSPADGLMFNIRAETGQRFVIDTSTNLVDWTLFNSTVGTGTNTAVTVPPPSNSNRLFIRLRPE